MSRDRQTLPFRFVGTLVAVAAATLAVSNPASAQEDCYRIIDLGPLGFTPIIDDDIFGINNSNQAVFTAMVGGKKHAMLYLPANAFGLTAGVHDLHTLAGPAIGDASAAHDINSAGIVVGWAGIEVSPNNFEQHAFVWRLDIMEFIDLGTFSGGTSSAVYAINDDTPFPMMVGDGDRPDGCGCTGGGGHFPRHGFALLLENPPDLLDDAALLEPIPNIPPTGCYPAAHARDVNSQAAPAVAGFSSKLGGCFAPNNCGVAYAGTAWINPTPPGTNVGDVLAVLPPIHDDPGGSQAWGVSDTGAMVGNSFNASVQDCQQHAVYWHTASADPPLDLGLAGDLVTVDQTVAVRINNNQPPQTTLQAVGWKLASPDLAFLWECDGNCNLLGSWSATELDDAIQHCSDEWTIRQAHDVNDNGWIISIADANPGGPLDLRAVILFPDQDCQVCCLADLDCDGDRGVKDLLILLGSWGPCDPPPLPCDADLDCDGTVGVPDLLILLGAWGPCGAAIASGVPQTIQDCMDRFSAESEDELALIKCLETVSQ